MIKAALRPMEQPRLRPALAQAPSRIGFGCASLGSRVGASAGLYALAAAREAGVVWFDVAPAYGAGAAENLLGDFLQGRRHNVRVTTKVGIAPPARLALMKAAYALGRPLIGSAAGLRASFRSLSATRNRRLPLSGDLIARSIEGSLRRLRIDHVDVFALHDPDPADVGNDEILRALEQVLERGQARAIGVAGTREACVAAKMGGEPYSVLQMSVEALARARTHFADGPHRLVTHSVFGVNGGMLGRTVAALKSRRDKTFRLIDLGYSANAEEAAADLLLDYAFALNPDGVVLASMFNPRHRAANLLRAKRQPFAPAVELVRELLG